MSAAESHAAALAKIARALEVEEGATPGPWRAAGTGTRGGDHWYVIADGEAIAWVAANDGGNEDEREPIARAIVLARSLLRPALVGAREALEQHRPNEFRDGAIGRFCTCGWLMDECPDAARALELVSHIPEEGS